MDIIEVVFQPEGKHIKVTRDSQILDIAQRSGIELASLCGGRGLCGKCKVIIKAEEKALSHITDEEKKLLTEDELRSGYRLSCRTRVSDESVIIIPTESRRGHQRLQIEGIATQIKPEPMIVKKVISVPKPSLEDQRADINRVIDVLEHRYNLRPRIKYDVIKKFPMALRQGRWKITVTIWNADEVIDVEPGNIMNGNFGFAVDLGTTKIACYLLELNTGELIRSNSMMNPQILIGEDIITRISYAMKGPQDLSELQEIILTGLNSILNETCNRANVEKDRIYEITIVGNTAMHHLFLGLDPRFLAVSPYTPVIGSSIDVEASKLNIDINPNGKIHILPNIAGFVGSDCIAGILATDMYESDAVCFFIDIGTNTEIVIGDKAEILVCSCASGPAFEGAHIKHGMRAASGAIERVWIDPDGLEPRCLTIGGNKPSGICGSGIVDALSEMLKLEIINKKGRIMTKFDNPRIRMNKGSPEFVLVWKEDAELKEDIVITQSDIREIQKAKAAMYSGASILMKKKGLKIDDMEKVFIAGAFGTYINPASARTIGMFPDFSLEKIIQVGNAAGTGARMALLSSKARQISDRLASMVRYVELANDPGFRKEYMKALYLPHLEIDQFPRTMKLLKGINNRV